MHGIARRDVRHELRSNSRGWCCGAVVAQVSAERDEGIFAMGILAIADSPTPIPTTILVAAVITTTSQVHFFNPLRFLHRNLRWRKRQALMWLRFQHRHLRWRGTSIMCACFVFYLGQGHCLLRIASAVIVCA